MFTSTQTHEEWAQSDAVEHVRSSPSPFSPQQEVLKYTEKNTVEPPAEEKKKELK